MDYVEQYTAMRHEMTQAFSDQTVAMEAAVQRSLERHGFNVAYEGTPAAIALKATFPGNHAESFTVKFSRASKQVFLIESQDDQFYLYSKYLSQSDPVGMAASLATIASMVQCGAHKPAEP